VINQISTEKPTEAALNQAATLLQPSERRSANWDLQNAVPNYVSLILSQGGSAIFALASVLFLTHFIGKEGYGGVVAVIAASQIVQILVNWTGFAVVRFGVDEFVETGHITRTFWLRLLVLLPNLLLVFLLSRFWFQPLAQWLKLSNEVFGLLILHFVSSTLWLHLQFSLQGAKMPKTQGILLTIERVLIFFGLLICWGLGQLTALNAVFCYAVVPLSMTAVGFWLLRKVIFGDFSLSWNITKDLLKYSIPLLPFSLIGYFSSGYVDAVFVSSFLSTGELGVYWVASTISGQILQLPTLANSLLIPLFITLNRESQTQKTQQFFKHILPSLTLFWGLFCNLTAFLSYFLFPLVFKKEFVGAIPPFWILLSMSVLGLPVLIGYSALSHATSKTYISMIAALVSAAANFIFNLWLIPQYGMIGCAWATAMSYLASVVMFAALLKRENLMPISWLFQAILPALGGAVSFTLTNNPFWSLFVCLIITAFVFYTHYSSLQTTFGFVKNFRKNKPEMRRAEC
jgi:O-antigen/teichoic acid export membrane protein